MASVTLSFGGKEIKTYELTKPATVVGRDPGADIVIDNLGVSRSHCQFIRRGAGFVVQDMNSANGTYVNGTRVGEHNLSTEDQVVVGKYLLIFKAGAGEAAAPAAPGAPAGARAVPAAGPVIPDALNTYMMDGNKIKERLEEMRRHEAAPSEKPAASAPAAPARAPAAPPPPPEKRVEHHTRIIMGTGQGSQSKEKRYMHLLWIVIGVLILMLLVLVFFSLKNSA